MCIVRVERGGAAQPIQCRLRLIGQPVGSPHREIHERVQRIQLQSARGVMPRCPRSRTDIRTDMQKCLQKAGERQPGVGPGKPRVQCHRAVEMHLGQCGICRREPVRMMQSQMVVRPGIKPFHRTKPGRLRFVQRNVNLKRCHQMGHDPGPQIVDPDKRRIQPVPLDHLLVAAVGEFERHGQITAAGFDTAGKHIAHAQRRRDQRNIGIRLPEAKR